MFFLFSSDDRHAYRLLVPPVKQNDEKEEQQLYAQLTTEMKDINGGVVDDWKVNDQATTTTFEQKETRDAAVIVELHEGAPLPTTSKVSIFQQKEKLTFLFGWFVCLLCHVLFGIQPILGRYLQKSGASRQIPTMNLIFASNVLVLIVYSPRLLYLLACYIRREYVRRKQELDVELQATDVSLRDQDGNDELEVQEEPVENQRENSLVKQSYGRVLIQKLKHFLNRYIFLIIFIVSRVLRTSTNVLSSRLTKAIYVQLLGLSTPFMVSAISICIVNRSVPKSLRERWSFRSVLAMIIAVLGGALVIVGGAVNQSSDSKWYSFLSNAHIDWSRFGKDFGVNDIFGMVLSLIASLSLSIYMISARFMNKGHASSRVQLSEEYLFLMQLTALSITSFLPSFLFEDWKVWFYLTLKDWFVFVLFSLCNYLAANFLMLYAVHAIGASSTGSVLALRLISTIAFSGVVLGEWFVSIWQLLGSLVVMTSISFYLYCQSAVQKAEPEPEPETKAELDTKEEEEEESQACEADASVTDSEELLRQPSVVGS